ncbi:MAG: NfeD family protein [Anaerolineales bacterium]|nr:NfeD family protein [Anaerolineales bacterium]
MESTLPDLTLTTGLLCTLLICGEFVLLFMAAAIRIVPEEKRLRVQRLGRDIGLKRPGVVLLMPAIDRGTLLDADAHFEDARALIDHSLSTGETLTAVYPDGQVRFAGNTWTAVSDQPIPSGRRVRVKRVLLDVEAY